MNLQVVWALELEDITTPDWQDEELLLDSYLEDAVEL